MNVLIVNDDGINAKGIIELVKVFSEISDVYVVAPNSQRSSNSHHLTIKGKIRYEQMKLPKAKKAFALWGTPADCVHIGVSCLIKEKIDLVVSGINKGMNASTDIIYSGTIAAAREAYLMGYPAMAVSLDSFTSNKYEVAAKYAKMIALKYIKMKDNTDYFLNINVPLLKEDEIKGIKICDEVGHVNYNDSYERKTINDKKYVVIKGGGPVYRNNERLSIDLCAVKSGYVSVSALHNEHISRKYSQVFKDNYI